MRLRFLFLFVLTPVLAVSCKSSTPSKEEMDRLIDQRLAERGLAPLPSGSASGSSAASASTPPTMKSADAAEAALEFLAKLDALMKDYVAPLPASEDKTDMLRCVTSDATSNDPDLQKVATAIKQRAAAATRERKRKEAEFYKTVYPLAFHYDLDWRTRKGTAVPDVYGCWEDEIQKSFLDSDSWDQATCKRTGKTRDVAGHWLNYVWKVKTPGRGAWFTYTNSDTAPTNSPELMRRIEVASIKVPERFSCRVDDVIAEKEQKLLRCRSNRVAASIRVTGSLKAVNVGDLVSVPLAGTKRDPDGVLFKTVADKNPTWIIDADGAAFTIDAAATCPSVADIVTAVSK